MLSYFIRQGIADSSIGFLSHMVTGDASSKEVGVAVTGRHYGLVLYGYKAESDRELTVKMGDQVRILEVYDA